LRRPKKLWATTAISVEGSSEQRSMPLLRIDEIVPCLRPALSWARLELAAVDEQSHLCVQPTTTRHQRSSSSSFSSSGRSVVRSQRRRQRIVGEVGVARRDGEVYDCMKR
jgi:hypothetical protein